MREIPTNPDIPHYTQQSEIGGKTYTFEFEFIERENFWLLHIADQNGQAIVNGVKLVPDWPLLRRDAMLKHLVLLANEELKLHVF